MKIKLEELLPRTDKLKHDYLGTWIYIISLFGFLMAGIPLTTSSLIALAPVIFSGAYKELQKGGNKDEKDFLFTVIKPIILTFLIYFFG